MTTVFCDVETFGELPINRGTDVYSQEARLLCLAWAVDDGPVEIWDATAGPVPAALDKLLRGDSATLVAHNRQFEHAILGPMFNIKPERWRCSMARAYCHGLPGALEALSVVFGLNQDEAKSKEGRQLIQLFCKPRPKNVKDQRVPDRHSHPAEWQKFLDYCKQDVVATRILWNRMPSWNYPDNPKEMELWHLDGEMNRRGLPVDVKLAEGAVKCIETEMAKLKQETHELTDGELDSPTRRDATLTYFREEFGIIMPNLRASTVDAYLEDQETPAPMRALLELRQQASATSTAKYKKLLSTVGLDDRLRYTHQFSGAGRTSRTAHRLWAPGNLARAKLSHDDITLAIDALKNGSVDLVFDNVMEAASSALRGCIKAPDGMKLVVSDLAAIEGRVTAWLAGEETELDAYRAYDAGTGPDVYKTTYANSFNVPAESVTKAQRQIGKICALFLGYFGGTGAFVAGAAVYRIDLDQMAKQVLPVVPEHVKAKAAQTLGWFRKKGRSTFDLPDETFIACDSLKQLWRASHPKTVQLWAEVEEAFRCAAQTPDTIFKAGEFLQFSRTGNWLRIRLPSGRYISYAAPRVEADNSLSFLGVAPFSRQWKRLKTHAGVLVENCCQATARDVLFYSWPEIVKQGYEPIANIHDEFITVTPDTPDYPHQELSAILSQGFSWSKGLPLAASGYESKRFKKD